MAGLVKELLLDYALNRLNVEMHSDLTIAIQSALSSQVFTKVEARILNMYLSGYTSEEISTMLLLTTVAQVDAVLERLFIAIEQCSGYTDESFIHKLESTQRYRKSGIRDLTLFLDQHGKHYEKHELE